MEKDKQPVKRLRFEEIVLCQDCKGEGIIPYYTEDPGYEGPWKVPCEECGGTGRLRRRTTVVFERIDSR